MLCFFLLAQKRSRSIKEVEVGETAQVDKDDGETWYPVENANESDTPDQTGSAVTPEAAAPSGSTEEAPAAGPPSGESSSGDNEEAGGESNAGSSTNEDMLLAIQKIFEKWGYSLQEIPAPFGKMDSSKPIHSTPEFNEVLTALTDKLPSDLEEKLRAILELARSQSGQHGAAGTYTNGLHASHVIWQMLWVAYNSG